MGYFVELKETFEGRRVAKKKKAYLSTLDKPKKKLKKKVKAKKVYRKKGSAKRKLFKKVF